MEWDLLLEEDAGLGQPPVAEVVGAMAETDPVPVQVPHQEWSVEPYVPPPPPELESLPGGVLPTEFVEQVLAWGADGMPYRHVILAARNRWGIRDEDELPLLHLAVLLVLGTRRLVAQGLLEIILQRLQTDPTGATLLDGILAALLAILR